MKTWLLRFGIKESQYERPNQPWICGWAAMGEACRIGPDAKGRCRATYECAPIREEARWKCTRPPLNGGPCEEGPLPSGTCSRAIPKCQPVRSLRAKRGQLGAWASALTAGLLAFALASDHRGELLSPGDLAFQHGRPESIAPATLLLALPSPSPRPSASPGEGAVTITPGALPPRVARATETTSAGENCRDCHVARGPLGWLAAAFGAPWGAAQSQLCLRCHALGEHPLKAHSRPPESLAPVTARVKGAPVAQPSGRSWECASCHREHRGRNFPIAFMGNASCQTCHASRFRSLGSGHPEFSGYPYKRGIHLKFDHNKHKNEYFRKASDHEDRAFECRSCHVPDSSGRSMLVRGFDQTCSRCHAAQIAENEGIAVLSVPGLDPEGLKSGKARIGEWPNRFETDLSPFMRLLLMGEKDGASRLEEIKGVDILDLAGATDEELKAVQAYTWSVKRLFYDLSVKGHEALRLRLEKALYGEDTRSPIVADLVGQIPPATAHGVRRAWFPHLMEEMKGIDSGGAPPAPRFLEKPTSEPNMVAQGMEPKAWLEAGGWYRDDRDFTVRYRPTRHGDAFLHSWLDVAAGLHDKSSAARQVLELLSKPTSPGRCMKCHSAGTRSETTPPTPASGTAEGKARAEEEPRPEWVRWTSRRPDPNERSFTKFSHSTHFSLLGQAESCFTCHLLAGDAPQAVLESRLMGGATSDFVPMQKARCLTCHVPRAAGDNCILCHNYHVGVFSTTLTATTPLTAFGPASAAGAPTRKDSDTPLPSGR